MHDTIWLLTWYNWCSMFLCETFSLASLPMRCSNSLSVFGWRGGHDLYGRAQTRYCSETVPVLLNKVAIFRKYLRELKFFLRGSRLQGGSCWRNPSLNRPIVKSSPCNFYRYRYHDPCSLRDRTGWYWPYYKDDAKRKVLGCLHWHLSPFSWTWLPFCSFFLLASTCHCYGCVVKVSSFSCWRK